MVVGLLGNESPDSNRFILVTPKSENDVRLQVTLGNQNPTGLPVGAVRDDRIYTLEGPFPSDEMDEGTIKLFDRITAKYHLNESTLYPEPRRD